jgi:hypothetical protein
MKETNYYFNKIKPVILFIYDYSCVICGYISLNNHIHHIDKNHKNNHTHNLVPLCKLCHRVVHKTKVKLSISHSKEVDMLLKKLEDSTYNHTTHISSTSLVQR